MYKRMFLQNNGKLTHARKMDHPAKWVPTSVLIGATTIKETVRTIIKSCIRFSREVKYDQGPDTINS